MCREPFVGPKWWEYCSYCMTNNMYSMQRDPNESYLPLWWYSFPKRAVEDRVYEEIHQSALGITASSSAWLTRWHSVSAGTVVTWKASLRHNAWQRYADATRLSPYSVCQFSFKTQLFNSQSNTLCWNTRHVYLGGIEFGEWSRLYSPNKNLMTYNWLHAPLEKTGA
jgi:hypothetical protein